MIRVLYTAKTANNAALPRNLLQVTMLVNNSKTLYRNKTLITGMNAIAFNGLNYQRGGFILTSDNQTYVTQVTNPTTNVTTNKTSW